jgi:hypothetical protein
MIAQAGLLSYRMGYTTPLTKSTCTQRCDVVLRDTCPATDFAKDFEQIRFTLPGVTRLACTGQEVFETRSMAFYIEAIIPRTYVKLKTRASAHDSKYHAAAFWIHLPHEVHDIVKSLPPPFVEHFEVLLTSRRRLSRLPRFVGIYVVKATNLSSRP